MTMKKEGAILAMLLFALSLPLVPVEAKTVVTIPLGSGTNTSSPGYSPSTITVVIGVNNTVIWVNSDTVPHTVTSDSSNVFDSGNMNANQTFTYTLTTAGKFAYHCTYHSWMHGTVIVKSGTVVPEFPISSLAIVLLVAVIAVATASGLVRRGRSVSTVLSPRTS